MSELPRELEKQLRKCFRMPAAQTMVSRKTSITNAFVNAIIPMARPTPEEIAQALSILGMTPDDVRCAYCGDKSTEWDHLRPLVIKRRPTGYISEIGNLVPACGKCNQSKGNKEWHLWMTSNAPHAPARRGVQDLARRIERLRAYERWRPPTRIPFEAILGSELYASYWRRLDTVVEYMTECWEFARELRVKLAAAQPTEPRKCNGESESQAAADYAQGCGRSR